MNNSFTNCKKMLSYSNNGRIYLNGIQDNYYITGVVKNGKILFLSYA
jgi:hypothetical protein